MLDLSPAFTADSTRGLYGNRERREEGLNFRTFGRVEVDGVPFQIVHPGRTADGNNVIVLRGGEGFAKTLPRRVEFPVGMAAARLHFLGGVAGWGYPQGEPAGHHAPVLKATIHYTNGATEELIMHNGREFADWTRSIAVPGSKEAGGLLTQGQVRWFTRTLGSSEPITRIVLESFDNHTAPTLVAITAELL
jgi:uncharacterized protein